MQVSTFRHAESPKVYRFEPQRYVAFPDTFAFVKVFDGERLAAIVRAPDPGVAHERSDHWRLDCGQEDYEPVLNPDLKGAVCRFLGTDKVSVFWPWKGWNDRKNTEPFPEDSDWQSARRVSIG